ncbi:MAG: zinc-ribbon domain-containing protein [Chloroflexi bacterium]|nr:zinc-ribbon domain-containing protein [Chloroflexota bacterium]
MDYPNCNSENPDGARFCMSCGSVLAIVRLSPAS